MSENFRKESRNDFHRESGATTDDLRLGCLQRIADATEAMAKRHTELIADRDRYQRWYEQEQNSRKALERQASALRGQITKLKRRLSTSPATT